MNDAITIREATVAEARGIARSPLSERRAMVEGSGPCVNVPVGVRDNPYRRFYDRLGGEMLNEHKQEDYGEGNVTSVAYGWRDLESLSASLEGVTRTTP
jgi:hypothetical protein